MSQAMILEIVKQVFQTVAMLTAPILLSAALVGVLVSIIQAITSIQEQTLVFIPKMFVVMLVLFFAFPWMMQAMVQFTHAFFHYMLQVAR